MNSFPTFNYRGRHYSLPYWLPRGESGKFSVEIKFEKKGVQLPVVSMRNSIFMGLPLQSLFLSAPLGIHCLKEKGHGIWMTSAPQEIEQHSRQLKSMKGRVLVGGLGLGVAVTYLEANRHVDEIVVIEKSQDVISLVSPYLSRTKTRIHKMDLYKYLKEYKGPEFDHAFYDIWCPTGETVLLEHIFPLKKASKGIVPVDRIECWNEEEMLGQIRLGCQTAILFLRSLKSSTNLSPLDETEEIFQRCQKSFGLSWYWYRWLRLERPTFERATSELNRFMQDVKDPERFERDWI